MTARSIYTEDPKDDVTVIERHPSYCHDICDACYNCLRGQKGLCRWDGHGMRQYDRPFEWLEESSGVIQ